MNNCYLPHCYIYALPKSLVCYQLNYGMTWNERVLIQENCTDLKIVEWYHCPLSAWKDVFDAVLSPDFTSNKLFQFAWQSIEVIALCLHADHSSNQSYVSQAGWLIGIFPNANDIYFEFHDLKTLENVVHIVSLIPQVKKLIIHARKCVMPTELVMRIAKGLPKLQYFELEGFLGGETNVLKVYLRQFCPHIKFNLRSSAESMSRLLW